MKNYTLTTCTGRTVVLHGGKALREYLDDIDAGEAEAVIGSPRPGVSREDHRHAYEHGLCYGPCSLGGI